MELASLLPIILIGLVFWLLLIRPAQRRQKTQSRMQAGLGVGDRVMLTSGILATVQSLDETDRLRLIIADGVVIEVVRAAIAKVVEQAPPAESSTDHLDTPGTDEP